MAAKKTTYLNNPNLPGVGTQYEYTPQQVKETIKCRTNILHFAENYFYIINLDKGRQLIELHSFQKKTLRMIRDNRFNLLLFSRQASKTTLATIFLLWYAIFNKDKHILLVANKEDTAKEIFGRVRLAFEELPNWLKPAVKEWGKEGMELANGSKIKITTTTSSAGRGSSCNVLFIDECDHIECVSGDSLITLRDVETSEVRTLPILQAYDIHDIKGIYDILTPDGFKPFAGIKKHNNRKAVVVTFEDKSQIIVSPDHEFLCDSGSFTFSVKSRYKKIKTENGFKKVSSVKKLKGLIDLYDATDVEGSVYLTNGVASHNCNLLQSFWASVYPIISSSTTSKIIMASTPRDTSGLFYRLYQKSVSNDPDNEWVSKVVPWYDVPGRDERWAKQTRASMDDPSMFEVEFECKFKEAGESAIDTRFFEELKSKCTTPVHVLEDGNYKIWQLPEEDKVYSVGVDTSEGIGKDACVVHVFDITDPANIIQVAQYHNRNITPSEFTPKLHEILQNWGNPLALIERNNCGAQVVDNLRKYYNYENIVNYGQKEAHRKNDKILGVIAHTNSKNNGIRNLRYWVNVVNSVHINDVETVNELRDFQRKPNGTWGAIAGKHDDRVMSMIWSLMLLSDDLVRDYFDVIEVDENRKPLIIKQLDYGVKYFMNPTTIYTDTGAGENAMPSVFGNGGTDIDDLYQQGWQLFGDFNDR